MGCRVSGNIIMIWYSQQKTSAGLCSRPSSTVQIEDERGNLRKLNSKEASICEIDNLIDKMVM